MNICAYLYVIAAFITICICICVYMYKYINMNIYVIYVYIHTHTCIWIWCTYLYLTRHIYNVFFYFLFSPTFHLYFCTEFCENLLSQPFISDVIFSWFSLPSTVVWFFCFPYFYFWKQLPATHNSSDSLFFFSITILTLDLWRW